MIGKDIEDKGALSLTEVWEILEKRRKERELTYEQQLALDHAEKFKLSKQEFDKIHKKLSEINGLDNYLISKIIDIKPKDDILLKQILASEKKELDEKSIADIIKIFKDERA
ncbi:MAG: hypothetical protein QXD11_00860 [Candidatus Micrarchaeaceae archaeon]